MSNRFSSFLKSHKKRSLLKYFFYEIKTDITLFVKKFKPISASSRRHTAGKLNLSNQTSHFYGSHRSGWNYAVHSLKDLHNPNGVLLDAFIERTFANNPKGKYSYTEPWIGFMHIPPGMPDWYQSKQSNQAVFDTDEWKRSISYCRGLFTLSEYHKRNLQSRFDFPVENLVHPTEFPKLTWSYERFARNRDKKLVQVGWWLRKLLSIYQLEVPGYQKIVLKKRDADMEEYFRLELEYQKGNKIQDKKMFDTVRRVSFLSNRRYDRLLSENIVFLDLYDSSANNAIIECIARNTPLLVNPIEPVTEYLGKEYPLYFNSLEEAASKAEDMEQIRDAHNFLVNHPMKQKITGDYFRESLVRSQIYQLL